MSLEPYGGNFPRVHPTAFVHATAVLIGDVEIGAESSVWPGAVLRADFGPIRIGRMTSIQDNAVIHATPQGGTYIGNRCIIGHLAMLEEAVVEDDCLVGVGARILNGARMRCRSVAAAQTVVLGGMEVFPGMRAQGIPATLVAIARPTPEEIRYGAEYYARSARRMAAVQAYVS